MNTPNNRVGLIYLSRHNPQFKYVAVFGQCLGQLQVVRTEPLLQGTRRAWTIGQIDKYRLALEP
jgi:hypothetical protein